MLLRGSQEWKTQQEIYGWRTRELGEPDDFTLKLVGRQKKLHHNQQIDARLVGSNLGYILHLETARQETCDLEMTEGHEALAPILGGCISIDSQLEK